MGDVVKKYKELIGAFEAELALDGDINSTVYIFRAKNYQGLSDKQELVVTPNTGINEPVNAEQILSNIPGIEEKEVKMIEGK